MPQRCISLQSNFGFANPASPLTFSLRCSATGQFRRQELRRPFPSIGDAVVGCRDPANTANWVEIITGKLWERNVQDGESHILTPSLGDVATGVRGFFHAYIRTGGCSGYEDGDEVTVEAQGYWYGIEMICVSDPHGGCYWIPAIDLRGGSDDFSAGRRR